MRRLNIKPDRIQIRPDDGPRWLGIDVRASMIFASLADAVSCVYCVVQEALERDLKPDVEARQQGDHAVVTVEVAVPPKADLAVVHRQLEEILERGAAIAGFEVA